MSARSIYNSARRGAIIAWREITADMAAADAVGEGGAMSALAPESRNAETPGSSGVSFGL
uniref:hypothetical protein n=1 Tax=Mesorhizobium sp. WSM4875 TaxID=3038539 RepID=UPI002416E2FE|nr:hypothetical protein [Mesorhizobium sp. WSM4875]WIE94738.1 hypothetical protein P9270_029850 [Mesorhizobium sp. WSM4875]